jgi:acetolactate synthase small subunit
VYAMLATRVYIARIDGGRKMAKILQKKYNKDKVKEEINALIDMHDVCKYEVTKTVTAHEIIMVKITVELPYMEPNKKIIV